MGYRVMDSHEYDSGKVVEVMVEVAGTEGPTEELRKFSFFGAARYKVDSNGKQWHKTGADYKAEIEEKVNAELFPKVDSPIL